MTEVGKNKLNHPSLGTAGGAGLHSQMEGIFTEISNNLPARWKLYSAVANGTTLTFEHNLQVPLSDIRLHIYTSASGTQTRLTNLTGWTIAATSGYEQTKVDVTVPPSGGPFTFYLYLSHEPMNDKLDVAGGTMTGNISLSNSYRITQSLDPSSAQDVATKNYVDNVAQGLDVKQSVRVATTANITLSGLQTIDGVGLAGGQRVLVKDQTNAAQNGIYEAANGAWSRASDMTDWSEVPGAFVFVEYGNTYNDTGWVSTTNTISGTVGTTAITWSQFAGVGVVSATAGQAVSITNNVISTSVDESTLSQSGATLKVKDAGITGTQLATGAVDLTTAKVTGALPLNKGGTGTAAVNANAALNALLPSQTSSANKYLKTDGTNTLWASASGGAGELNCVLNSSGADGKDGWTGLTLNDEFGTGALSPLHPIVSTSFKVQNAAGAEGSTSGAYYSFTLSEGLYNRKLKVEFYYSTPATDVYAVSVRKGGVRVPLSTDSPNVSTLPQSTKGKFVAYFDTDNSASWTVHVTRTGATNTGPCYITNVIVGPGIQPQGAVIGPLQDTGGTGATVRAAGSPITTFSSKQLFYCREGEHLFIRGNFYSNNAASAGELEIDLPLSGTSVNSNMVGSGGETRATVGFAAGQNASDTTSVYSVTVDTSTNRLQFMASGGTNPADASTVFAAANHKLGFECRVPIAEWAGSGTVNLAQNDVEYAYNTDATDAPNTSSFGYGPSGTPLPAVTFTAGRLKRVGFNSPIQPTDVITLEIDVSGQGQWAAANGDIEVNGLTVAASTSTTGIGRITRVSANEVDVYIGQYRAGTSNWAAGTGTGKWRVKKVSGGAAVGFGHASATESGLVNTTTQTFAGDKTFQNTISGSITGNAGTVTNGVYTTGTQTVGGLKTFSSLITASAGIDVNTITEITATNGVQIQGRTSATAIPAGYIGQVISFTSRSVAAALTWTAASSSLASLTVGHWVIYWQLTITAATGATYAEAAIATNNTNGSTGLLKVTTGVTSGLGDGVGTFNFVGVPFYYYASATTPIYAKAISYGVSRAVAVEGFALRIQ